MPPRRKQPPQRTHAMVSSEGITPLSVLELSPADVETAIQQLFAFVNHHQPISPDAPETARALDRFFTVLYQGWRFSWVRTRGLARWVMVAMKAVEWEVTHADRRRLRRCAECGYWMFTKDPRRLYCTTPACVHVRSRQRTATSRQIDKVRRQIARERIERKRVTGSRQKTPR